MSNAWESTVAAADTDTDVAAAADVMSISLAALCLRVYGVGFGVTGLELLDRF
jgi:hypothetical protein